MKFKRIRTMMLTVTVLAAAMIGLTAGTSHAISRVVVSGAVDVHVWVDEGRDVYPSYDDVVFSVEPSRDCYTAVFVVDTDGFVHMIHPLSPYDDAWLRGGVVYRIAARDVGLRGVYGRGIAYVFAVGSPYPFDFAPYGDAMFMGHFGYRVYGDPFIACRELYVSILPATVRWSFVGVSYARFYVREWARYPHYLCTGHPGVHVRVGEVCPSCAGVYDGYRRHAADPYRVINPRVEFKRPATQYARIEKFKRVERVSRGDGYDGRVERKATPVPTVRNGRTTGRVVSTSRTVRSTTVKRAPQATRTNRVVKEKTVERRAPQPARSREVRKVTQTKTRKVVEAKGARAAKRKK